MATKTLSSREANHDFGKVKKAALGGPVIITHRGQPAHVLMAFEDYKKLTSTQRSAAEALAMPGGEEIDFDPPRSRDLARAADLS